jgi:hypothetical protein
LTTQPTTPSTHPTKMRRYYIVPVILLMLPNIDHTVAAPVLVQEKRQAGVNGVHIPEGAITMLGKRGFDGLNELWPDLFGDPADHFSKPESSPASRPSPNSPPSGAAGGSTDVKQPLPSIPEEPSSVSSPDHAPQSADDKFNELFLKLLGGPKVHYPNPEESPAARPSSSLLPSGPAYWSTGVKQPLLSIPEVPSSVSSLDHAPQSADDKFDEQLVKLLGGLKVHYPKPESSAARPSSSLPPSGPADGLTDLKQPLPSIPEEPSPVSSEDHTPPSPGSLTQSGYELMKWGEPPGPSGPASSTNLDRQSMGADSPSGKRRKTVKGLWFATRD